MGKKKKVVVTPVPEPVVVALPPKKNKAAAPAVAKKRKLSTSYKIYLQRLCKSKKIPSLSKDALILMQQLIENIYENIVKQSESLLDNGKNNRMFTQKTAQASFISLMTQRDVDPKLTQGAVEFSANAVSKLQETNTTNKKPQ